MHFQNEPKQGIHIMEYYVCNTISFLNIQISPMLLTNLVHYVSKLLTRTSQLLTPTKNTRFFRKNVDSRALKTIRPPRNNISVFLPDVIVQQSTTSLDEIFYHENAPWKKHFTPFRGN